MAEFIYLFIYQNDWNLLFNPRLFLRILFELPLHKSNWKHINGENIWNNVRMSENFWCEQISMLIGSCSIQTVYEWFYLKRENRETDLIAEDKMYALVRGAKNKKTTTQWAWKMNGKKMSRGIESTNNNLNMKTHWHFSNTHRPKASLGNVCHSSVAVNFGWFCYFILALHYLYSYNKYTFTSRLVN